MKFTGIFNDKPETWGYRGDPYFWDYLKDLSKDMELDTADELEKWIKSEYKKLAGKDLSIYEDAVIERFAHGGMSSGGVKGCFWIETGIPLLKSRLQSLIEKQ